MECSSDLLDHVRQYIMTLVLLQEKDQVWGHTLNHTHCIDSLILQPESFVQILMGQLDASLSATLAKYLNRK